MRITVFSRGGMSVYGGLHDPHRNEAVVLARDDTETVAVTIEYPAAPSSPTKTTSSLTSTTPTVSGKKITCTLSAMKNGGYADISATVDGALKKVRIRARTQENPDLYESASDLI